MLKNFRRVAKRASRIEDGEETLESAPPHRRRALFAVTALLSLGAIVLLAAAAGPPLAVQGDMEGSGGVRPGRIASSAIYVPHQRLAILFSVTNRTAEPIRVLRATTATSPSGIVRFLGARLRLGWLQGPLFVPGLRSPYGRHRNSEPVVVSPGRQVWIQFDYLERACRGLPRRIQRFNRTAVITYELAGVERSVRLSLGRSVIVMRAPRCFASSG
jgi:hypothetical protein